MALRFMNFDSRTEQPRSLSLPNALGAMERAQLVRRLDDSDAAFLFKHALVQDTAYSSMLRHERKRLHRLVGEALERAYPERIAELSPRLAEHFDEAGETARALFYFERAATDAAARFANREALDFFARALDAAEELKTDTRDTLYRARGLVYERVGEFESARVDLERALEIARTTNDAHAEWQSLMDLGFAWTARDYTRAGEYFEKALELARASNDAGRIAHSLNRVGNWYLNVEDPERALAYHHEALSMFQTLGLARGLAETHDLLGMSQMLGGDMFAAYHHFQHALEMFEELGDARAIVSTRLAHYFYTALLQGNSLALPQKPPPLETGLDVLRGARELGWRAGEAYGMWILGEGFAVLGEYGRALDLEQRALAMAREIDHRQWLAAATMLLGAIHAELLDWARAQAFVEEGLKLSEQIDSLHWQRTASGFLASIYIKQNELTRAAQTLDKVLEHDAPARTLGQRQAWTARVELALAQREPQRALDALQHLLAATYNLTPDAVIPRLWMLRARALMQLERAGEAENLLLQARGASEEFGLRPILWRVMATLCQLYRAQGRDADTEREAGAAGTLVKELAATVEDVTLRENFAARASERIWGA